MNRTRITHVIALPAMALVFGGVTAVTPMAFAGAARPAAGQVRTAGEVGAAGQVGAARQGRTAGQVRTAERTLLRAAVNGDTHTAGALLAADFQQIDVTGTPETRADYLANIGGGVDFVTLKPVKPISVRVHGDTAIARVELRFKVVAHGTTVQHQGWTTDVFQRRNGHWKLVWSQSTAIPHHLDLFIRSLQP